MEAEVERDPSDELGDARLPSLEDGRECLVLDVFGRVVCCVRLVQDHANYGIIVSRARGVLRRMHYGNVDALADVIGEAAERLQPQLPVGPKRPSS